MGVKNDAKDLHFSLCFNFTSYRLSLCTYGIVKNYLPQETENKWYSHWLEKGYFQSTPNEKPAYTIVIPPQMLQGYYIWVMPKQFGTRCIDTICQTQGYNTCWVPGTDHASIATEAKVASMLRDQGIDKNDLTRDEFLKHAWEWKEKYGGIILQQLKSWVVH